MAQMNISLPDAFTVWAESRVAEGSFSSISEYVVALIRRDQEDAERLAALQAEIDKGFASPIDPQSKNEIFAKLYSRLDAARSRTAA